MRYRAVGEWVRGKLFSLRILVQCTRHLTNGVDVWAAVRRRRPVTHLALRGGLVIHARPEDDGFGLFWEIIAERCYTGRVFYRPQPEHTVVDIGANIGVFVLECQRRAPGIRVHAVEPAPTTVAQLRANLEANRLAERVTVHELAVSDAEGTLHLTPGADLTGHQVLNKRGAGPEIPAVTLDGLFARAGIERCDLLKIDTEGAEMDIVHGASPEVWPRVGRVVIEYHYPGYADAIASRLTDLGFRTRVAPTPGEPHLGLVYGVGAGG